MTFVPGHLYRLISFYLDTSGTNSYRAVTSRQIYGHARIAAKTIVLFLEENEWGILEFYSPSYGILTIHSKDLKAEELL